MADAQRQAVRADVQMLPMWKELWGELESSPQIGLYPIPPAPAPRMRRRAYTRMRSAFPGLTRRTHW